MSWGNQPTGFSCLIWVNTTPDDDTSPSDLLLDAISLLSIRWGLEFIRESREDEEYAWCTTTKFTVGEQTLNRALGDLVADGWLGILRCSASTTLDTAIRFRKCKQKWNVPDVVSQPHDDSSGTRELPWKRRK